MVNALRSLRQHYSGLWVVFVFLLIVTGFWLLYSYANSVTYKVIQPETLTPVAVDQVDGLILPRSLPVRLRIPSLEMIVEISEMLNLQASGEIEIPATYDSVGWYINSPTPGELGPAVLLGHVDSQSGPAVFFSLGQLSVGEEIFVDRADGSIARFVVTAFERPVQNAFPTTKVYGDIDHAGLRLITCSGIYVRGAQRYTHNLIVYARLVDVL